MDRYISEEIDRRMRHLFEERGGLRFQVIDGVTSSFVLAPGATFRIGDHARYLINVDTSSGTVTCSLPNPEKWGMAHGMEFIFRKVHGANTMHVEADSETSGTSKINGVAGHSRTSQNDTIHVSPIGTTNYAILSNV